MWFRLFIMLLTLFSAGTLAGAEKRDIGSIRVETTITKSEQELINRSGLIVMGRIDSAHQKYPTAQQVSGRKLVNFVQTIQVKRVLKGNAPQLIRLVTTGVEPLPDPGDPLNNKYPGALAEGDYVCFLKKMGAGDLYSIVGVWQGVYPFADGKSVAMQRFGYPAFHGLTLDQFHQKIQQLSRPRSN